MSHAPSRGIILDSESIRAELAESPGTHDLSAEQVETIAKMTDDELNVAIDQSVDDAFWEMYDIVRREAIGRLASVITCPTEPSAARDQDGFCTVHGNDCADYAMSRRAEA